MSQEGRLALNRRHVISTENPTKIFAEMTITGEIPRLTDFEDTGGAFYTSIDCQEPDLMLDDISVFVETAKGLVVILGCAHSGVVNILEHTSRLTGNSKIHTIIGGMHLLHADRQRIDKTIKAFDRFGVEQIYPVHCTGTESINIFIRELAQRCQHIQTGESIVF